MKTKATLKPNSNHRKNLAFNIDLIDYASSFSRKINEVDLYMETKNRADKIEAVGKLQRKTIIRNGKFRRLTVQKEFQQLKNNNIRRQNFILYLCI